MGDRLKRPKARASGAVFLAPCLAVPLPVRKRTVMMRPMMWRWAAHVNPATARGRIVLASPFQLRGEIKRRFAVFAGHRDRSQMHDGTASKSFDGSSQ